ncbi:Rne/Rng family ribonuclease, partial [Nocardiopsis composta]|uniref:Rne/Rng family ribonuclease n=1 Tax=Nocardiopsis composta TaxID=157465 RepID=UPI0031CDC3F9
MLENEPNGGADGTAGTTETTETAEEQKQARATVTVAQPQQDFEVKVSTPAKRGKGAVRAAGPPPEPEPAAQTSSAPLTAPAGTVEPESAVAVNTPRKGTAERRASAPAAEPAEAAADEAAAPAEEKAPAKTKAARTRARGTRKKAEEAAEPAVEPAAARAEAAEEEAEPRPRTRTRARGSRKAEASEAGTAFQAPAAEEPEEAAPSVLSFQAPVVLFQPPVAPPAAANGTVEQAGGEADEEEAEETESAEAEGDEDRPGRRRRRRGGRGRGRSRTSEEEAEEQAAEDGREAAAEEGGEQAAERSADGAEQAEPAEGSATGTRRRRRRRRRGGSDSGDEALGKDDPPNTVVKVREPRAEKPIEDEVQSVRGSTRLEAKKQRRREGREQGRRRTPIITESEFLARRESVKRDLVIRRIGDRTQIGVLEDDVLVEHYVDRSTHRSYVGNVYLGRVQNVLPSMEAAFVDVGKGRNAVLYAGEVNWDASGLEGQPKRIESVLKSGQSVLVQVTKDPIGHKGARLTSQISLPGRYLVYVPDGSMTGISRKLPDKERARLKQILKKVMPANAGVIVRTAAEGASEEELERDISRLAAQWESIKRKSKSATAPALLNSEPDLTVKVVRDVFNEDFSSLVVSGDEAWDTVHDYVDYVAPQLAERLVKWDGDRDIFEAYRIDEQIAKGLERKVWLPSGGSLVIDRTEAMTVVDVNTGKFTGQGGNLEETVTKNNLEAAEEIVRQLRLRDIGGIIVIDFIDMVLESNRDLVLRRLLECLSRDRTKHQVAEVTSLGLVQMTRKRVGQGLLEAFSHNCEHCNGRGLIVSAEPVEGKGSGGQSASGRKKKGKNGSSAEADKAKDDKAEKAKEEKAEKAAATSGKGAEDGAAEGGAAEGGAAEGGAAEGGAKDGKAAKAAEKGGRSRSGKSAKAAAGAASEAAEERPAEAPAEASEAPAEQPAKAGGSRKRTRKAKEAAAEPAAEQPAAAEQAEPAPAAGRQEGAAGEG